ncbi:ribosome biogenesis GTPase YlqF [Eubacteriales bacterium OttesenSCG-928-K08]|nr:ribosome biogenesis GTPase YlqF [Eubacteriales bacterium OttesenSCG-928-K08]
MEIQWYPGHMAKAKRLLQEDLKLIDVVAELVDARAPRSTGNPDFDELFKNKSRVVILNKSDLADPALTKRWVERFCSQGKQALPFVSTGGNKKAVVAAFEQASAEKVARMRAKGVTKTVRILVAGIPNVGKSTFINRIAGGTRTRVGDRPGVTRGKQWVKITPYLEMMDTPGLLWPKLDNETYARRLAYIGSIRDDIMDVERLAGNLLIDLKRLCPNELNERYKDISADTPDELLLQSVCKSRSFILPGNEPDTMRAASIVLDEYRAGRIARVTFDDPDEE